VIFFKKFFKFTTAFILFPVVIFFSIYSLDQHGFFKIEHIDIKIKTRASQKIFIASKKTQLQLKLSSIKGISLWAAPLSQISKALSEEKWIEQFQISRAWPSSIVLEIVPDAIELLVISQQVSLSVAGGATEMQPITKSGNVLEKIKSDSAPNAIITHEAAFIKNQKIREGAIRVISSLPKSGNMSAAQVSEIGYDKKEGYWIKLLKSETKVNFGEEQFEIKSARVTQVVNYLENRNLKARVIDANLSKKVLVRLQQNP